MQINTTKVYKCLDKKTLILGFEIIDLFALMIVLALLNFFTSYSQYKLFMTWVPVGILAITLKIAKRGKPDLFLVHWLKFHINPKIYMSYFEARSMNILLNVQKIRKLKQKGTNDFKFISRSYRTLGV